jgi:putative membrane protein
MPTQDPIASDPRVPLAAERTLLAWVRTGLALMGFGFVVARFGFFVRELAASHHEEQPGSSGMSLWAGTALVLCGVLSLLVAAVGHLRYMRRLARGAPPATVGGLAGVLLAAALAALGLAMAAYLVASR